MCYSLSCKRLSGCRPVRGVSHCPCRAHALFHWCFYPAGRACASFGSARHLAGRDGDFADRHARSTAPFFQPCSADGCALGHADRDSDCGLYRGRCLWRQGAADLAIPAGLVQQCVAPGDAGPFYRQAGAGRLRQVQTLLETGGCSGFVIAHVLHPGLAGIKYGRTLVHGGARP
uniref:Uncharacterized protein n=1 Tax=Panagrolaimus superbus TaxID=310955 RepID=A0A914XY01_9BILA